MRKPFAFVLGILLSAGAMAQGRTAGRVGERIMELEAARTVFSRVEPFTLAPFTAARGASINTAVEHASFLSVDNGSLSQLVAARPTNILFIVPTVDGPIELHMVLSDIHSDDFSLVTASATSFFAPAGLHYRGTMAGQPTTLAAISIFSNEVMGFVSDATGNHVLGPIEGANDHIYYAEQDLVQPPTLTCATPEDDGGYDAHQLELHGSPRSVNCVDLYWEVNHDIYLDKAGITNTANYISGLFNQHATLYDNDGISVLLSQLFIWDVPSPYTGFTPSVLLGQFQGYRNSFNGDLGHLMGYAGGGGIAAGFVGLCAANLDQSMCYSGIQSSFGPIPAYSNSVMVVTHEQGHLLGSRHTHACVWNGNNTAIDGCGPAAGYSYEGSCSGAPIPGTGGTIMSYCHLNAVGTNFNNGFGPQPKAVILNNVESAACLTDCGGGACGVPTGLTAIQVTGNSATLAWNAVAGALNYNLQWKPTSSSTWTNVWSIATTGYTLVPLAPNTTYDYRVRSICSAGGASAVSTSSSFTTPACVTGAPCNDADPATGNDVFISGCTCAGQLIDCFGVPGGQALPGSACDDGDQATENDVYTTGCICTGHVPPEEWEQIQKIVASDRAADDEFGDNVDISGNYAIVSASFDDPTTFGGGTVSAAGSAYIFVRSGDVWVQQQKIQANSMAINDRFGTAVAIDGDYAIVGAAYEDQDAININTMNNAGAAYIFVRNGTTWTQQQKIVASDRAATDGFGFAVAISGDHAIVGASQEDEDAAGGNTMETAGSAYIFVRNGSTWTQQQKIVAADRAAGDYFSTGLAITNTHALVGSYGDDLSKGSAYVFVRNGTIWTQQQKILASDAADGDHFGNSVALSGDRAVIGALTEDHNATGGGFASSAGAAYVFARNGSTWTQQQKIVASDRAAGDNFGKCVDISGDRIVVGAALEDENAAGGNTASEAGSAYIFKWNGSAWTEEEKIVAGDRAADDHFGWGVAISDVHAVVGAHQEDEDTLGTNTAESAGSAYVFSSVQGIKLALRAKLAGPYNTGTGLMNDGLRTLAAFPLIEPYGALGYGHVGGGGESTSPAVLAATGDNAVADWVVVEVRDPVSPVTRIRTCIALLQRDGDVVSVDGSSPVALNVPPGSYHVAIRHRNHLGVMTSVPLALSSTTTSIDFTNPATPAYGTNGRSNVNGVMVLWPGDVIFDGVVRYVGASNDRDPILQAIGGSVPTNTMSNVYNGADVNMDGTIRYVGANNDRDVILQTVGGAVPTATRTQQLP